jgi:hypothetical protein
MFTTHGETYSNMLLQTLSNKQSFIEKEDKKKRLIQLKLKKEYVQY